MSPTSIELSARTPTSAGPACPAVSLRGSLAAVPAALAILARRRGSAGSIPPLLRTCLARFAARQASQCRRDGEVRASRTGTAQSVAGVSSRASLVGRIALLGVIAALVVACGSGGTRPEERVSIEEGPPPAVLAEYQQALRLLGDGDEAGAELRLQAMAEEHGEYAGPLVNLALIQARRGELEAAAALLERAVAVCAQCAAAWNELGVVQRRQGRFDDAERSYLAAIAADPAFGNAHFNLGVLYELYLRRPELALDQYARFLGLHAEDPGAADVEKWMVDLKRRAGTVERSARLAEEPT